MGQALYRKYRSKALDEIIGQEHITRTLEQALTSGRLSHAYLFTGPRGVGKTSIARILAHVINDLPYENGQAHLDIIEIDAASNRRIDEIRDLREKVYISPTSAKYKVYIIDEVHMLTKEAFNALLKTLEEPPAHVVFILATTEVHKLPETIVSRTQRFTFKPVERSKVVAHLKHIAKAEKIDISEGALELIAEHGEGSFRDSISLLDQASHNTGKIETDDIRNILGLPPENIVVELLDELVADSGSAGTIISLLDSLYEQGYQAGMIARQLGEMIRARYISQTSPFSKEQTLELLRQLLDVPAAYNPDQLLEIVLLEATASSSQTAARYVEPKQNNKPVPPAKATTTLTKSPGDSSQTENKPDAKPPEPRQAEKSKPKAEIPPKKSTTGADKLEEVIWPEILAALKKKHNTLYSFARLAHPDFSDGKVRLAFAFSFHCKRLNEAKNRQLIVDVINELTGQTPEISCVHDESLQASAPAQPTSDLPDSAANPNNPALKSISNIFGGAELLQSE